MLTALLLVTSFALGPAPTPAVTTPAPSRAQAVAELGAAQDPGFAGWLANQEGLPATATATGSGPISAPAVSCVSDCTKCAAMHRSCCFDNMTQQCFYCVPAGVKCL